MTKTLAEIVEKVIATNEKIVWLLDRKNTIRSLMLHLKPMLCTVEKASWEKQTDIFESFYENGDEDQSK